MDDPVLLELLGLSQESSQSDGDQQSEVSVEQLSLTPSDIARQLVTLQRDGRSLPTFPVQVDITRNVDAQEESNITEKGRSSTLPSAKVSVSTIQTAAQVPYNVSRDVDVLTSAPGPVQTSRARKDGEYSEVKVSVAECVISTSPLNILSSCDDQVNRTAEYTKSHDRHIEKERIVGNSSDTANDTPIYTLANMLTEMSMPGMLPELSKSHLSAASVEKHSLLNISHVSHVVHSPPSSENNQYSVINHKIEDILKQPYMCGICGKVFSSVFRQRRHLIEDHHLEPNDSTEDKEILARRNDTLPSGAIDNANKTRRKHNKKRLQKAKHKISKKSVSSQRIKTSTVSNEHDSSSQILAADSDSSSLFATGLGPIYQEQSSSKEKVANSFKCEFCEENFTSNKYRYKHRIAAHPDSLFECPGCDKTYKVTDKDKWQHHIRIHNKPSPKPRVDLHGCDVCGIVFKAASSVTLHMQNIHPDHDHDDKPFCCEVCGDMFRTKRALKSHQTLVHSDDHPFTCTVCNRRFKMKAYLKLHERKHTGERPYACQFCGKVFSSSGGCRSHERSHTNERPFKCSFCENTFKTKQQAVAHGRTHTKEKPFPCHLCNKSFASRTSCNTHQFLHTGQKPYQCSHCTRAFAQKTNLTYHFRSVHCGEKPYDCTVCELKFSRSTSRKLHMEKKHGLKITVKQGRPPVYEASVVELESGLRLESGPEAFGRCQLGLQDLIESDS